MTCFHWVKIQFSSIALVAAALSSFCVAFADEPLLDEERALAQALVNHPEIVAAKAKVALASAELSGKRMEVSRQVLGLYGSLSGLSGKIQVARAELDMAKADFERTEANVANKAETASAMGKATADLQAAEAALVLVMGEREQAEKELRLLIGPGIHATEAESPAALTSVTLQAPQGPIVDKIKAVAGKSTRLEFGETPLAGILEFLSDHAGIKFSAQRPMLESYAIATDMPISLSTDEVQLLDALQAFEDAYPDLQFVLRDYGVLLTVRESVGEQGFAPLLPLMREAGGASNSR